VEKAAVRAGANLVDDVGLEIAVDCARHVLALAFDIVSRMVQAITVEHEAIPVSEKKVENPWSSSAALRSSVRYPSGFNNVSFIEGLNQFCDNRTYLNAVLKAVKLQGAA
jgi:hypothetical protein